MAVNVGPVRGVGAPDRRGQVGDGDAPGVVALGEDFGEVLAAAGLRVDVGHGGGIGSRHGRGEIGNGSAARIVTLGQYLCQILVISIVQVLRKVDRAGISTEAKGVGSRITSYNVCYTKLLR